jgi:hypothetical protein
MVGDLTGESAADFDLERSSRSARLVTDNPFFDRSHHLPATAISRSCGLLPVARPGERCGNNPASSCAFLQKLPRHVPMEAYRRRRRRRRSPSEARV